MPPAQSRPSYQQLYVYLECPCGRELRVKRSLAGSEVRCWDCQQMVLVPSPRTTGLVLSTLGEAIAAILSPTVLALAGLAAAAVAGLLFVSGTSLPVLPLAAMIVLAVGYGQFLQRGGERPPAGDSEDDDEPDETDSPPPWSLRAVARAGFRLVAVAALGTALWLPWFLTPRRLGVTPRLSAGSLALGLAAMMLLPLVVLAAFASDRSRPLSARHLAGALRRHLAAFLFALLLFPLAAVLAELVAFGLTGFLGWLPFFLLELSPEPRATCQAYGIPYQHDFPLGGIPDRRFLRMYLDHLGQGYTLVGSIPHSLGVPRFQINFPWADQVVGYSYLALRMLATQLIFWLLFLFLALQAAWLGRLATLDLRTSPTREPRPD
jgi:hypothetical protein